MQPTYAPRLHINPPQGSHGASMLASPGAPYFASPASYSQLPFGGGGGGMASPGGAAQSPVGFFPPHLHGQYQNNAGLGIGAPPMGLQHSLGGSEMMRSSSSSSTWSIPPAPLNYPSAFFPNPHLEQQRYPQQVISPPLPPAGNGYSPPSRNQTLPHHLPPRSKLHASTPSFHPGQAGPSDPYSPPLPPAGPPAVARLGHNGRTQSISIRPGLKSPDLSRAPSISPAPTYPKDEGKKKKVIVRFPREKDEEDPVGADGKEGRKQSRFQRRPLAAEEKDEKERRIEQDLKSVVALEEDELAGRPQHPEEVKMKGLPETLEVFLPGNEAWEDVWDGFVQETNEKYDLRKPSFLPSSARSASFLNFDASFPSSSASGFSTPNPRNAGAGPHGNKHSRTASLFSATPTALPPRLASVLDGFRRPGGHGSSLSLSFTSGFSGGLAALRGTALSSPGTISPGDSDSGRTRPNPLARSFTMPGWNSSPALPSTEPVTSPVPAPLAAAPVAVIRSAESTPLPPSPMGDEKDPLAAAGAALSPSKVGKWKPSLKELGKGFGIAEEDEEEEQGEQGEERGLRVDEEAAEKVFGESKQEEIAVKPEEVELDPVEEVIASSSTGKKEESNDKASEPIVEDEEDDAAVSAPSRRTSMMTDHTGVASDWDNSSSASEAGEIVKPPVSNRNSSVEPEQEKDDDEEDATRSSTHTKTSLSHELSRAISDLGEIPRLPSPSPSLPALPSLPDLPDLPAIEIHADGSDDEYDPSESDWADAELSQSEYSNPSEEENARARAIYRARSSKALRAEALEQHQHLLRTSGEELDLPFSAGYASERTFATGKASSLAIDPDVLFQAPSDIDASDIETGGHKVTRNFEFPPRSPEKSPVKKRDVDKVPLPSSPESLSNLVQPDLPPIGAAFGQRQSSLNVGAPEFTLGASSFGRRASTTSSNGSLGDGAFGVSGHPGSLAASPSLQSGSPPKTASSALNPVANDFRPSTFALQQQASSNSLASGTGWGSTGQPGSIAASSPGFTPTLDPTPQLSALASEFTPPSHDDQPHAFDFLPPSNAPALVMPAEQPRRASGGHGPLPPIPLTTVTPHTAAVKRQKVVSAGESSWLPSIASSLTDRIVSTPQLAHPQPRRPLPNPPLQLHRHFGTIDADLEDSSLHHIGNDTVNASMMSLDDPLPEQYAPAHPVVGRRASEQASQFTLRAAASFTSDGGPALNADGKRRSPLPSFESPGTSLDAGSPDRSREQASPARMGDPRARKESVDMVLPSSHRPKSKALPIPPKRETETAGNDIFDDEALPLTPVTDEQGSVVELEEGAEEDDLPLRILEGILATQFEGLKAELATLRPAIEQDKLVDAFAHRVELLLLSSRQDTPSNLAQLLSEAHDRIENVVTSVLGRIQQPSSALTLIAPRPSLHPEPQMSLSAPTTPLRPSTPGFDGGPAAAYGSFLDDLRATVQPLTREPINVDALSAKVAALVQPQLADILSRLPVESNPPPVSATEQLDIAFADFAASVKAEKADVAEELATRLAPSLLPLASLEGLGATVAAAVAEKVEEKLGVPRLKAAEEGQATPLFDIDTLVLRLSETVQSAQAATDGDEYRTAAKEAQDKLLAASLATQDRLGQLSMDVTNRLDVAYSQLEDLVKAQLSSSKSGATGDDLAPKVAELEIQLAKSRNEHGRARSEKAVLADRLEAEKARHAVELDDLRKQLAKANDTVKAHSLEKTVADAQAERLQEELAAAKARTVELEEKRNLARKSLEEEDAGRRERDLRFQQQSDELARLKLELEHQKSASRAARGEQAAVEKRLRAAEVEKEQAQRERNEAKEASAAAKGTITGLEKRLETQDDRLSNLQRLKVVQQQTLATANQRNAELRKDVADLKTAQADLAAANLKTSELEVALAETDARVKALLQENDQYHQQFTQIEQGLRTMKEKVTRELDEASARIGALTDERDRLAEANTRLAEEKEDLLNRLSSGANGLAPNFHPLSPNTPRNGHSPFLSSAPDTPPSFTLQREDANGFVKATALVPQHTGDSINSDDTVAHTTFSPAPSISARSYVPDDDGWYGPA